MPQCVWGRYTLSNPLPLNTLSVVACTLPPFRCRSHCISLLLSCGNICAICSMCAGLAVLRSLAACVEVDAGEKKK